MVLAAADGDRVFLEHPEPRRRLSRIDYTSVRALDRLDILTRQGRDARQTLQKIERCALADEQRTRRTGDLGDLVAGTAPLAVLPADCKRRHSALVGHLSKHFGRDVKTCNHAVGFGDEHAARPGIGLDRRARRQVAAADVLLERPPDDVAVLRGL